MLELVSPNIGSSISAAAFIEMPLARIIGISKVLRNKDTVVGTPPGGDIAAVTLASLQFKGYAPAGVTGFGLICAIFVQPEPGGTGQVIWHKRVLSKRMVPTGRCPSSRMTS